MAEHENSGVFVNLVKVLLLLINMVFLVTGCLIVYFSHRVKNSGWLQVFENEFSWIGDATLVFLLVLGAVVISLATMGCVGAWLRQRLVLMLYTVVLLLTMVMFAVVIYGASAANSKTSEWGANAFPAQTEENKIAENFNKIFCYAQVPYYCTQAKVSDVLNMFDLPLGGYFSAGQVNFSSVCGNLQLDKVQAICSVCDQVDEYESFEPVLTWAEEQCPRNTENQKWCAAFLLSNEQGEVYGNGSPYSQCRPAFYSLVETWTNATMVGSIVACFVILAMLMFTCVIRRDTRRAKRARHERVSFYD